MATTTQPAGKMNPPNPQYVVTGTGPGDPQRDWNSTDNSPVGRWLSVDDESGPADFSGHATGDFEDGPGWWRQT